MKRRLLNLLLFLAWWVWGIVPARGQGTVCLTLTANGSCSRTLWIGGVSSTTGKWLETYPGTGSTSLENPTGQSAVSCFTTTPGLQLWATEGGITTGQAPGYDGAPCWNLGTSGSVAINLGTTANCGATNGCESTNVFYQMYVSNPNNQPMVYQAFQGTDPCTGTPVGGIAYGNSWVQLGPGESANLQFGIDYPCPSSVLPGSAFIIGSAPASYANFTLNSAGNTTWLQPTSPCNWQKLNNNPTASGGNGGPGGTSSSGSGGTVSTVGATNGTPTAFSTNDVTSTNGIIWSGASNGVPLDTGDFQLGMQALYNATVSGFGGVHNDLQSIYNTLSIANVQRMALSNWMYNDWSNNVQTGINSWKIVLTETALSNLQFQTLFQTTNWQGLSLVAQTNLLAAATNIFGQNILSNTAHYLGTSNLLAGLSNAVASGNGSITNALTGLGNFISNSFVRALNGATNGGAGTNTFDVSSITNDANANMASITNRLGIDAGVLSNGIAGVQSNLDWATLATNGGGFDSNGMLSAGAQVASGGSNAIAGVVGGLPTGTAMEQGEARLGSAPASWTITAGAISIDLNPFDVPWVADLAAWCRAVLSWVTVGGIIYLNSKRVYEAICAMGAARQASSAATAPGISTGVALAMAGVISAVMLGIPVFAVSWFAPYMGVFSGSPFPASGSEVATGLWMADQFFPISLIVGGAVVNVVFIWLLGSIVWFVQTVVRFLVG